MHDTVSCDIQVHGAEAAEDIDPAEIRRAVQLTLERHGRTSCTLSIALVDDATIARLHQQYMNQPDPTDVLTFDLGEECGDRIDGEIVISLDTAARESTIRGRPRSSEVLLYAVHGTLHLLGYDDQTPAAARKMHAKEDELLTELGVGPTFGMRVR